MTKPIKVLMIEDAEADGDLAALELRRRGIELEFDRVESAAEMRAALAAGGWDIVLCDYVLPGFGAEEALRILQTSGIDVPFIVLSGIVRTRDVIEVLRSGADDFIDKNDLDRLAPSVERALREAEERRALRQSEIALHDSEQRFRVIFEETVAGIALIGIDAEILSANPAFLRILNIDAPLPQNQKWTDFTHQDDLGQSLELFDDLISGKTDVIRQDKHYVGADGTAVLAHLVATAVRDSDGKFLYGVAIIEDVGEQRHIEAQLRQAQKMEAVGQLTGGIAHDFNNLLTIVMGNLELLQVRLKGDGHGEKSVLTALSAVRRGAELTHRLLAVSRRQTLSPDTVDINQLVNGMTVLLQRSLGEEIEIVSRQEAELWPALVDAGQLENVILNLAINARDAMIYGGRLTISTRNQELGSSFTAQNPEVMPGEYVVISVDDNGSGMAPDVIDRVFEPFFTTKDVGKGSGLGLSMVFGFIKQSNGHINIESQENSGTSIKVYLPRSREAVAAVAVGYDEMVALGGEETVLVVEDDPDVRNYVVGMLSEMGYQVYEAEDGKSALQLLDSGLTPELLFSDVVLPGGLNGKMVAEEALKRCPDMKVLFTSGYAASALGQQGEPGVNVVMLNKPYTSTELGRKLRAVLDGPIAGARVQTS
jgi:PAS domain S-box-containing protein